MASGSSRRRREADMGSMLDLIADQLKAHKNLISNPDLNLPEAHNHAFRILESMRIALQQHEALLLYAHKTLDLDYHRRADEIYETCQAKVDEDKELNLPHKEKLARINRFFQEAREARAKLDEKFNIGEEASN